MLSRRGFVVSGIAVSGGLVLGYAGWQLDDGDAASKFAGSGWPGAPGVAPALTNAIYNATGQRIRTLPVSKAA